MIQIICGENSVASRDYFFKLKKDYRQKNYLVVELKTENLNNLIETEIFSSLFHQNKVFFAENLYRSLTKNETLVNKLNQLFKEKIHLYIWEEKQKYELRDFMPFKMTEFKPEKNIFELLDVFFPGNKKNFFRLFHKIINEKKESLFFYLLTKRIRQLILIKNDQSPIGIQSWQLNRLKSQANKWTLDNLIRLYQSLFNIEIDIKTSQTPYSLSQSLDILSCYFL
jgi:hypothetical protein